MSRSLLTFASLLCASSAGESAAEITLCPSPDERYRSPLYQVSVDGAGAAFVYYRENGWKEHPQNAKGKNYEYKSMSADNNWVSLSTDDEVELTVKLIKGKAKKAELLPARLDNSIAVAPDGSIRVKLKPAADRADYYFVRVNDEYGNKHPLFIFVDPPEEPPPKKGPGVHFFGPGVHDIGAHYAVKNGETVYIAAGAVVRGTITATGRVTVRGRGILSGELLQDEWFRYKRGFIKRPKDARRWYDIAPMVWNDDRRGQTTVEGITVIDAPSYNLDLGGKPMRVRNVKLLSWNYSTDGVSSAPGLVENCFMKVQDDCFTMSHSNWTARNIVIWKQNNSAVFQLGYGHDKTVKNCLAEKIDIIRDETDTQVGARGIIGLTASKGCRLKRFRFQDITVTSDILSLLAIDNLDQDTPWAKQKKKVTLREVDLELRRIIVTGTERGQWWAPFTDRRGKKPMSSRLRTADPGSIRVLLEDVHINGVKLKSAEDFPNGLEMQGNVTVNYQ